MAPTFYPYYLWRAEALLGLDRKAEAIEPLEVYVYFSKNELEYPAALARLRELEK